MHQLVEILKERGATCFVLAGLNFSPSFPSFRIGRQPVPRQLGQQADLGQLEQRPDHQPLLLRDPGDWQGQLRKKMDRRCFFFFFQKVPTLPTNIASVHFVMGCPNARAGVETVKKERIPLEQPVEQPHISTPPHNDHQWLVRP